MIDRDYCLTMCQYNRWMNSKVIGSSAKLTDEAVNRDQGVFFGSIIQTMNHLYVVDQLWLTRFYELPEPELKINELIYSDIGLLEPRRRELDNEAEQFFSACGNDWFDGELQFTSQADGQTYSVPKAVAVIHFFNHQTHHRGQVSAMLHQQGVDIGVTDLPRMDM